MSIDWKMFDHAHLHLIWHGDLDLWPLTLTLLSLRPLVNFYLHTKFGRVRIKNDRVIWWQSSWEKNQNNNNNTQKTEQKQKGLRLRRQTLIIKKLNWTCSGTLQGGLPKHMKKELTNVLKPNWLAKCSVIREKKNFHEELKKNGNMTKFMTP